MDILSTDVVAKTSTVFPKLQNSAVDTQTDVSLTSSNKAEQEVRRFYLFQAFTGMNTVMFSNKHSVVETWQQK